MSCEARVLKDHPLGPIQALVDQALTVLSAAFDQLYADHGRPSIAPEKLLRALLLQAFYSVRSERQLMEQLDYNLLFRWFVGLAMDALIWDVDGVHQDPEGCCGGLRRPPRTPRKARRRHVQHFHRRKMSRVAGLFPPPAQWLSRGIAAPRQPRRKSRSAPSEAWSTVST